MIFRNGDGSLTAYEAVFDPVSKQIRFTTRRAGKFAVVCLRIDADKGTADFYEALEQTEEVKRLGK